MTYRRDPVSDEGVLTHLMSESGLGLAVVRDTLGVGDTRLRALANPMRPHDRLSRDQAMALDLAAWRAGLGLPFRTLDTARLQAAGVAVAVDVRSGRLVRALAHSLRATLAAVDTALDQLMTAVDGDAGAITHLQVVETAR